MSTTDKRIILSMAPFFWVHELASGTPGTIAELWRFDNLQSGNIKIPKPGEESSGDNIDINRGDGAIWRFPKYNLVLDGSDESDITPTDSSGDATGKCDVSVLTNEAPLPTTIISMTAWLEAWQAKFNSLFMITCPIGFTQHSRDTQKKVDGYVYCLAKMNAGIDLGLSNSPASLSLEFISYKNTLSGLTGAIIEAATFTGIVHKGKGDTYTPPSLTAGDGDVLLAGDVVIAQHATYTY